MNWQMESNVKCLISVLVKKFRLHPRRLLASRATSPSVACLSSNVLPRRGNCVSRLLLLGPVMLSQFTRALLRLLERMRTSKY